MTTGPSDVAPPDHRDQSSGLLVVASVVLLGVLAIAIVLAVLPGALGTTWDSLWTRALCEWCHRTA